MTYSHLRSSKPYLATPLAPASVAPGHGIWAKSNLGYWNYSSSPSRAPHGQARDLTQGFGLYYSSFRIDVDFSYGYSANVAPAWQSAGALYGSSVTI